MKRNPSRHNNHGVALLTALALLFVFSILGASFVRSVSIDMERSNADLAALRSASFARGGVEAAIGEIAAALAAGELPAQLGAPMEIDYPVYTSDKAAPTGISAHPGRKGHATVTVSDESGKVNLNHASPRVLQTVLGIDGNAARAIRASLPLAEAAGSGPARAWLTSVSDLVSRNLVPAGIFNTMDKQLVTVYSVVDHTNAEAFLNVNAASPQVLAAMLDIPAQTAQALSDRRPFRSLDELAQAAGKDPALFNAVPGAENPEGIARQLSFESRCYRIVSEAVAAEVGPNGAEVRPARSRIEAVVVFDRVAGPQITFWSEAPQSGTPTSA